MRGVILGVLVCLLSFIGLKLSSNAVGDNQEKSTGAITNSVGMAFVYIPAGSFIMGSPLEEKGRDKDENQRRVTFTKGFYLQTTEVTQRQWRKVMGKKPSCFKKCGKNCPVENVSWNRVQEFIQMLNKMEKTDVYRLPTEAEWEYACRAGTTTPFYFGACLPAGQANYNADYPMEDCPGGRNRKNPVPVASFPPNEWGLYDMHGNVWEWCQDWYNKQPSESDNVTDPTGPPSGRYRVIRGGSWRFMAHDCRSANRDRCAPDLALCHIGFRVAREERP